MEASISILRSFYDLTYMNFTDSQNQSLSLVLERRNRLGENATFHICFENCYLSGNRTSFSSVQYPKPNTRTGLKPRAKRRWRLEQLFWVINI